MMGRSKGGRDSRSERQAGLADFGLRAAEQSDLDALLTEAAEVAAECLHVEYVKVLEYMQDRKCLLVRAGVGWEEGIVGRATLGVDLERSEEHTSELQSLMRISYAVFCLKKKKR